MDVRVLDSLHRPFHRPLWIVKWVCYFFTLRNKSTNGYIFCKEKTTDFYFTLLEWLHKGYPVDGDGVPSHDSVDEVWCYFSVINKSERVSTLYDVLSKKREKGVETKIYSTYKAASYYLNLAINKLRFVNGKTQVLEWSSNQLTKAVLKSIIPAKDKKLYLRHILLYDSHFFLSMCLIQKPVRKYGLTVDAEIYKFMQKYYPVANFDYAKQSHSNYYVVRKRWVELLHAVSENGTLSSTIKNCIKEDSYFQAVFNDVEAHVKEYTSELRMRSSFNKQKVLFVALYRSFAKTNIDKSGFVNLYDISKLMRMSYGRFQAFLTQFYQEERLTRNIFFINIVSTIEQRKRFYIGNSPVIKIKISKNYGI